MRHSLASSHVAHDRELLVPWTMSAGTACPPEGSTVTDEGWVAVATNCKPCGVSAPVPELIVNPETVLSMVLATYRNLLDGSAATANGAFPVEYEPTAVSTEDARV